MELVFNELSLVPPSPTIHDANQKMDTFAKVFARAHQTGYKKIRSDLRAAEIELCIEPPYTLHDWLTNPAIPRRYRDFIFGAFVHPFISEDDEEIVDAFIESNFYFEDLTLPMNKKSCLGLASAHLADTICISLQSAPNWESNALALIIEKDGQEESVSVKNISRLQDFEQPIIKAHIENVSEIQLVESGIQPKEKNIHLTGHHGKAEIKALCKRLRNSPYVVAMRSAEFGGKDFLRSISADGSIEIVLTQSQREYAVWVQTTGRNLAETTAIANLLKKRYG